jgi:hypothetical protein
MYLKEQKKQREKEKGLYIAKHMNKNVTYLPKSKDYKTKGQGRDLLSAEVGAVMEHKKAVRNCLKNETTLDKPLKKKEKIFSVEGDAILHRLKNKLRHFSIESQKYEYNEGLVDFNRRPIHRVTQVPGKCMLRTTKQKPHKPMSRMYKSHGITKHSDPSLPVSGKSCSKFNRMEKTETLKPTSQITRHSSIKVIPQKKSTIHNPSLYERRFARKSTSQSYPSTNIISPELKERKACLKTNKDRTKSNVSLFPNSVLYEEKHYFSI